MFQLLMQEAGHLCTRRAPHGAEGRHLLGDTQTLKEQELVTGSHPPVGGSLGPHLLYTAAGRAAQGRRRVPSGWRPGRDGWAGPQEATPAPRLTSAGRHAGGWAPSHTLAETRPGEARRVAPGRLPSPVPGAEPPGPPGDLPLTERLPVAPQGPSHGSPSSPASSSSRQRRQRGAGAGQRRSQGRVSGPLSWPLSWAPDPEDGPRFRRETIPGGGRGCTARAGDVFCQAHRKHADTADALRQQGPCTLPVL